MLRLIATLPIAPACCLAAAPFAIGHHRSVLQNATRPRAALTVAASEQTGPTVTTTLTYDGRLRFIEVDPLLHSPYTGGIPHSGDGLGDALIEQRRSHTAHPDNLLKAKRWNWNSPDYDCDGDGTQDCGQFDYGNYQCKHLPTCGHQFKSGDFLMQHSCRCVVCSDRALLAAMDRETKKYLYGRWRGWNQLMDTCTPWLMPKHDRDIKAILEYAKKHRYKVRPSGATQSAASLVTHWTDKNSLAVSLAEYEAPADWEFDFHEEVEGKATVRVNAGWSPLQLYEKIRPLSYFLPTQTTGTSSQLGGMVANCAHGGNYQKGFLHQYVVSMRVMFHNGTIRIISDPGELRFWRNSYGLLGIITALEFSLDYRPQFQAYTVKKNIEWTEQAFWKFVKQDAHADLAIDIFSRRKDMRVDGDRKALMGHFFFNPYEVKKGEATVSAIVWRTNENATEPQIPSEVPADIQGAYSDQMTSRVLDEVLTEYPTNGRPKVHVYSDYNVAVKHHGGPRVFPLGYNINHLLAKDAGHLTALAIEGTEALIATNQHRWNDGFFAHASPNLVNSAYFIDPSHAWEAMNDLVSSFASRKDDSDFEWNGPPELRFITIHDDAVLNPAPPGIWIVLDFMSFPISRSSQGWKAAFKEIQDAWVSKYGAKPHIGKFWGFSNTSGGLVEPFQPEEACKIYSTMQKATFNAYRWSADPEHLFAAGDAMKLLKDCSEWLYKD